MTRRRALIVFVAAAALLGALNALVYSLYRSEIRTVAATLDDRLTALGKTTAGWLSKSDRDADALLATLVSENRLEDAYAIDAGMRVLAGVRTHRGEPLNLLRVDQDRLAAAFEGRSSAGTGYSVANARVEVAYFPVPGKSWVLVLEAGAEFHAPADRLRTTYLITLPLSLLVALVFAIGLGLALRSLERARLAHGQAERLAAVGQMAAMVAHEVRNPLGILRGQVELARERLPSDAPAREHERFTEMLAEIERLNSLTEEFLGLARDVPLDIATTDLADLARAVAKDAHVATSVEVMTVTPASGPSVQGDATRLQQAVRNLVLNAIQIGGPGVNVQIEVAATKSHARITVSDDGPGVSSTVAATLFDPFVTARAGGSGLGLVVAKRVAERHGGSITLESMPGARGARFSIYLPRETR